MSQSFSEANKLFEVVSMSPSYEVAILLGMSAILAWVVVGLWRRAPVNFNVTVAQSEQPGSAKEVELPAGATDLSEVKKLLLAILNQGTTAALPGGAAAEEKSEMTTTQQRRLEALQRLNETIALDHAVPLRVTMSAPEQPVEEKLPEEKPPEEKPSEAPQPESVQTSEAAPAATPPRTSAISWDAYLRQVVQTANELRLAEERQQEEMAKKVEELRKERPNEEIPKEVPALSGGADPKLLDSINDQLRELRSMLRKIAIMPVDGDAEPAYEAAVQCDCLDCCYERERYERERYERDQRERELAAAQAACFEQSSRTFNALSGGASCVPVPLLDTRPDTQAARSVAVVCEHGDNLTGHCLNPVRDCQTRQECTGCVAACADGHAALQSFIDRMAPARVITTADAPQTENGGCCGVDAQVDEAELKGDVAAGIDDLIQAFKSGLNGEVRQSEAKLEALIRELTKRIDEVDSRLKAYYDTASADWSARYNAAQRHAVSGGIPGGIPTTTPQVPATPAVPQNPVPPNHWDSADRSFVYDTKASRWVESELPDSLASIELLRQQSTEQQTKIAQVQQDLGRINSRCELIYEMLLKLLGDLREQQARREASSFPALPGWSPLQPYTPAVADVDPTCSTSGGVPVRPVGTPAFTQVAEMTRILEAMGISRHSAASRSGGDSSGAPASPVEPPHSMTLPDLERQQQQRRLETMKRLYHQTEDDLPQDDLPQDERSEVDRL